MPFKQGNSDSVIADTRSSRFLKAVSYVVIVVFMANLNAIVDSFVHDQIPYFDQEHLIVGAITGLVSALLFGALFLYSDRLKKVVAAKQADGEKLARSEKTYREVFESSKDVIFIQAHDGRFIDLNPAALEVFGYATRQEMVALDVPHDFYAYPEDWITRQKAMERNGYVENFEVEMVRKDGERIFVQETATAALDEQGRIVGYRGTMRDITQQRQLEAQLGQAQKMESIGRLAGGLSHDFNNYLTTISGHVEIAARSLEPDSPVRDSLREINNSVDKASGLIRQLRLFSRSQPINLEPVDINGIIWETKDMLARMMDRVTVSFQPANGLAAVEADRANIEQALLNLALNARKNMPREESWTFSPRW